MTASRTGSARARKRVCKGYGASTPFGSAAVTIWGASTALPRAMELPWRQTIV